jgi:hypothetical protein
MTAAEEMAVVTAMATVMAKAIMTTIVRMTVMTARTKTMMVAVATEVAAAFLPSAAMVMLIIAVLHPWLLGAYIPYESYSYVWELF